MSLGQFRDLFPFCSRGGGFLRKPWRSWQITASTKTPGSWKSSLSSGEMNGPPREAMELLREHKLVDEKGNVLSGWSGELCLRDGEELRPTNNVGAHPYPGPPGKGTGRLEMAHGRGA